MATNNYFGFTHGGTQYGTAANPSYPTAQPGYAVAPAATAAPYGTQRSGYDQAYQAAATQGTYAKVTATTNSNTFSNYDAAVYSATMFMAQQNTKNPAGQGNNWQFKKVGQTNQGNNVNKSRMKQQPKPQQIHYCEVCKISCAGPQTYKEHLEGQKHKKREASLKMAATAANANQSRVNNLHCELCDVTCTGNDAYAAHVRGSKHQKVVKLHQKLGKPIPSTDPHTKKTTKINFVPPGGVTTSGATGAAETPAAGGGQTSNAIVKDDPNNDSDDDQQGGDEVKPVGVEYIEEIKDEDGKILSFNCKLCECKFNDPNAKEMHMKGRRHRLQYKKKVQPDLVVDFKPTPRQRRIAEAKAQRAAMQAEYWNRQRLVDGEEDDYWEERRRFEEEVDYMNWVQRINRPQAHIRPPITYPFFGVLPGRRPESSDDRHVIARHAEIYPKEEELQKIQMIVSHTERSLKFVSDKFTEVGKPPANGRTVSPVGSDEKLMKMSATGNGDASSDKDSPNSKGKEDGRDNQMFSFQKEAEGGNVRILKGVMRVGLLAKGLLLQGDNSVQLVVLCAEKPTTSLLKRVAQELPMQLHNVFEEQIYSVSMAPVEGAVLVTDGTITVKISLTSPLLREQDTNNATATEQPVQSSEDLLPREPCLQALAALRHAKWFQARATGLPSCVMVMRILRDLCHRKATWSPLNQWAMELLVEKVISSAGIPLSPGDCLRRVMEAISTGILVNGPGIFDPCEKEPYDALVKLKKQQREDLTVSAQQFLRLIAFRQIHKVLGMDPLPTPKFQQRQWRFNRKRRRSGGEGGETEAEGKMVKKDDDCGMMSHDTMDIDATNASALK